MSRISLIILAFLFNGNLFSQVGSFSPPEYEKMRLQIFDNSSPFFYPRLFERYQDGDTSLTVQEFRYLYYGYTFQQKYIPYQVSRYQDKMIAFMKKGTLTSKELSEFIKLSELNLIDLPYDIRTLNILAYSYKQKGDTSSYLRADYKKSGILKAIQSTGNGITEKSAFHIIDPAHEYDILKEFGLDYAGSNDMTTGLCDYLFVQANEQNIRGFYFNVSRILNVKAERNNPY
jgi:hypothetical protein